MTEEERQAQEAKERLELKEKLDADYRAELAQLRRDTERHVQEQLQQAERNANYLRWQLEHHAAGQNENLGLVTRVLDWLSPERVPQRLQAKRLAVEQTAQRMQEQAQQVAHNLQNVCELREMALRDQYVRRESEAMAELAADQRQRAYRQELIEKAALRRAAKLSDSGDDDIGEYELERTRERWSDWQEQEREREKQLRAQLLELERETKKREALAELTGDERRRIFAEELRLKTELRLARERRERELAIFQGRYKPYERGGYER